MFVQLGSRILEKYPKTEVGFLLADVLVTKEHPFVESLKQSLLDTLTKRGIDATNFAAHPNIAAWRALYQEDFRVKPKIHRSSVEALVRRLVTGKALWNICSVVDLYHCCSVLSLLPMGGYDLHKIQGSITIRYGKEGERFVGLGKEQPTEVETQHVVYADEQQPICWLWNHKDSAKTCIDDNTKKVLFFVDALHPTSSDEVQTALELLSKNLQQIDCLPIQSGVVNKETPKKELT